MVCCGERIPYSCNSRTQSILCGANKCFFCKVVSKYVCNILMTFFYTREQYMPVTEERMNFLSGCTFYYNLNTSHSVPLTCLIILESLAYEGSICENLFLRIMQLWIIYPEYLRNLFHWLFWNINIKYKCCE